MVQVLVTGASGYIGFEVVQSLVRRGNKVYGLVRKQKDADELVKVGATPVLGDLTDAKSLPTAIIEQVSVVIDTVLVPNELGNPSSNRALMAAIAQASKNSTQKKRYIYCSGTGVYGDAADDEILDEARPPNSKLTVGRIEYEKEVLRQKEVDGVVIRPCGIFGGSRINPFLEHSETLSFTPQGDIEIYGGPNKSFAWVHVYDVGTAFALAAEAPAAIVAGELFNLSDDSHVTEEQLRTGLGKAIGKFTGKVVYKPLPVEIKSTQDFFRVFVNSHSHGFVSSQKIRQQLGWKPAFGPINNYYQEIAAVYKLEH